MATKHLWYSARDLSQAKKVGGDGLSSCLNAWNIKQNNLVETEISESKKSTCSMTHSPLDLLKINQNHMQ